MIYRLSRESSVAAALGARTFLTANGVPAGHSPRQLVPMLKSVPRGNPRRANSRGHAVLVRAAAGSGSMEHHAPAHVAGQPEEQHDDQHETDQSAAVMWRTPRRAAPVVVATASTEEELRAQDQEDQQYGTRSFLRASDLRSFFPRPMRLTCLKQNSRRRGLAFRC